MQGLWSFIAGPDTSGQDKANALAAKAAADQKAIQDKQLQDAEDQQDALDAQSSARKRAIKSGGRTQLLTGNELGVTTTPSAPQTASTTLG